MVMSGMVVVTVVTVTTRMGTRTAVVMSGTVAVTVVTVTARTTTAVVTAGTAVVVTTVAAWVGTLGGCCVCVCGDERGGRLGK